jgi:hypothetical protein
MVPRRHEGAQRGRRHLGADQPRHQLPRLTNAGPLSEPLPDPVMPAMAPGLRDLSQPLVAGPPHVREAVLTDGVRVLALASGDVRHHPRNDTE